MAKYALHDLEVSDLFGVRGRALLRQRLGLLAPHTAYATQQLLEQIVELDRQRGFEQRMQTVLKATPEIQLLLTLPGVGLILAVVIVLEVGDVARFATAEKLAAYAGTTPRVDASGGKTRFGQLRPDVNRYLKWAFVEAANAICIARAGAAPPCQSPLRARGPAQGATRRPSGPWPGIWPKRRFGPSASKNPIGNRRRRPFRPRGISAGGP